MPGFLRINSSLTANGSQLCMDYHDGKYGVNTDPQRGADTFIPFHSGLNGTVKWLNSNEFNIPSDVDSCIVIALLGSYAQNYVPNMNHTLTLSKGDSTLLLDKVFLSTNIDGWWIKACIKIFYLTNCKGSNVTCTGNYNHIMLY